LDDPRHAFPASVITRVRQTHGGDHPCWYAVIDTPPGRWFSRDFSTGAADPETAIGLCAEKVRAASFDSYDLLLLGRYWAAKA
jgi:hypothetical protein